jgi:hypothetical protein
MKILIILKQPADQTLMAMMDHYRQEHEVTVVDLKTDTDYDSIVRQTFAYDQVISW